MMMMIGDDGGGDDNEMNTKGIQWNILCPVLGEMPGLGLDWAG